MGIRYFVTIINKLYNINPNQQNRLIPKIYACCCHLRYLFVFLYQGSVNIKFNGRHNHSIEDARRRRNARRQAI